MPSIPPQSLIVVTGITGYIASHVGLAALQAGHRVRGTVRDLKRAQELRNAYAKQGVDITKLEFIVVDDITSGTQLANAVKGADGVAHVALPGDLLASSEDMPHHAVKSKWFIDVRDDGRLHIAALTNPSLSGKRIWGVAEPTGWNQILAILRKNFPDANVAPDLVGEPGEPTKQKIENTVATEALGGWIGLEQSLVDTGKSLGF
ncbi:predicted protein [Postia placenta Mad-698-R]|nr:predicted protein [Postia placenta Mad-698-R]